MGSRKASSAGLYMSEVLAAVASVPTEVDGVCASDTLAPIRQKYLPQAVFGRGAPPKIRRDLNRNEVAGTLPVNSQIFFSPFFIGVKNWED